MPRTKKVVAKPVVEAKQVNESGFYLDRKYRNLTFTLNNYTDDSMVKMESWKCISYLVYGKEVGEGGTPHLQGYVEFTSSLPGSTIKNRLPGAHFEPRYANATAKQASDYCKKGPRITKAEWDSQKTGHPNYGLDADIVEIGEISSQGKRSDIINATDMLLAGESMRDVAIANPGVYVKYHKGLHQFQEIIELPRIGKPEVMLLFGSSGKGKSNYAKSYFRSLNVPFYVHNAGKSKWFDQYDGQQNVVIDEYRGQMDLATFLGLLDWDGTRVEYKGGSRQFKALKIIITSPHPPERWYVGNNSLSFGDDASVQIRRRIDKIVDMDDVLQNPYDIAGKSYDADLFI